MKNCVLKNKHSSVRGSLTLEAAMIMPVIVFVQVLCIYMSVYVYNSLLISQVSYLACLRAVQTKEENNEVLAAEVEREIANLLQDELIFMKDLQWDIQVSLFTVSLDIRASMEFPFEHLFYTFIRADSFQIHIQTTLEKATTVEMIRFWKGMGL